MPLRDGLLRTCHERPIGCRSAPPHTTCTRCNDVPPTGMNDAEKPMPMEERMHRRFPQSVRVGDLIGLPVLDDDDSTIGFVRQVVRTPQGKIRLIVSYSRWFGWFGRRLRCRLKLSSSSVGNWHLWICRPVNTRLRRPGREKTRLLFRTRRQSA